MDGTGIERKNFIAYEYKQIIAESNKASLLLDGYESFGWEPDENLSGNTESAYGPSLQRVLLHLKRNRKIINKVELTRLQRNFETCINEIDQLERAKTTRPTIYALVVGLVGTAFMAGSVFSITAQTPNILLCILFAVPAFIGWVLPFFIFRELQKRETAKLTPLIEEKYEEIYELCEKGHKLLY